MKQELDSKCTEKFFVRVLSIDSEGIVLKTNEGIFNLAHKRYPWFIKGKVSDVLNATRVNPFVIHWRELGVALEIDSLLHPEKFPYITHL